MNVRAASIAAAGVGAVLLCAAPRAHAHKGSDSFLSVRTEGAHLHVRWDIALRDLDAAVGLDASGDRALDWGEVRARHDAIAAYALARLALRGDGAPCHPGPVEHRLARHTDGVYAVLRFTARCPREPEVLDVSYSLLFELDRQHRGLLSLDHGGVTRAAILREDARGLTLSPGDSTWLGPFGDFFLEGIWHIWSGIDHVLFLLALLLPAPLFRRSRTWIAHDHLRPVLAEVTVIVTAFTVAHSLTLIAAALGWISLPSRLVETAIALSVVFAALNNLVPLVAGRWWIAFALGLLHGFGFAGVLADLRLPPADLTLALVGFNVGVEFGQLAILAVFVPLTFLLRRRWIYRRVALVAGSAAIAAIGIVWAIDRAFP